jgi:hypothetical protein
MRWTEYGRNPNKRKEYGRQPDLLLVGVDVSKAKHNACLGTQTTMSCRKLAFTHTRAGFRRFEQTLRHHLVKNKWQRMRSAMEPSGLSWPARYERLKSCGYGVCLVHCQAVRNHRKTRQDGTSKTEEKDAYRLFALLRQGKFLLPVDRAPALQAAYRLRRRHMALKKRVRPRRHHLRAAIPLPCPALNPLGKDLTPPTAVRFLQVNPPPTSILRNGPRHFLAPGQPRGR